MDDFVIIAVLESQVQAQLLESILTDRDIPHLIKSYCDCAFDGLFQSSAGWGHVEAPEEHTTEILDILQDLKRLPGEVAGFA